MSYCRAQAGLRKAEVTEYDDMTLEDMEDFLLQLMAQLVFEDHSSAGGRGRRASGALRLSCPRWFALMHWSASSVTSRGAL
jgi:hypothetical protein